MAIDPVFGMQVDDGSSYYFVAVSCGAGGYGHDGA